MAGKKENSGTENQEENSADFDAEPEGFFYTAVLMRSVRKGAHWLEALAKSHHNRVQQYSAFAYDGHSCNRGVSIRTGGNIEDNAGKGCHSLTSQGRKTTEDNVFIDGRFGKKVAKANRNTVFSQITLGSRY